MARARNIKPGFYANEDLAECSIWARFIFPGLWMMADREGRLEYRPKKIKGELLRYDTVEAEPLLDELRKHGFIEVYEVEGKDYIQIVKFSLHQNPHHREAESTIPPPKSLGPDGVGNTPKPRASTACNGVEASGKPQIDDDESDLPRGASRADSGFLIPDSGFSDSPIDGSGASDVGREFEPSAAAGIAMTLIGWERARGKVPRGISASNAQVMDLAAMQPTPEELRKAYDLAVADRLATDDANPVNAGFLIALLAKVRNPPKARPKSLRTMTDRELMTEAERVGASSYNCSRDVLIERIETKRKQLEAQAA
ncbi:hypothetical protein [Cupriavidus sp. EM10]|uniref:hypothetical protein n=1 Tax=Cupriavidus sp. EM10 TaxID=2839983 RepID=UPI001C0084FE|nr:hypothetical protein [Cupriavidus sp. EM10]QWE95639.1 hypothetical protein KLP38_07310 [Cupriavidus sp. EM10]